MFDKRPYGLASRNDLLRSVSIFVVDLEQWNRLKTPLLRRWFLLAEERCFVVQPEVIGNPAVELEVLGFTSEFSRMLNAWVVPIGNRNRPLDEVGATIASAYGADVGSRGGWADRISWRDYIL